MVCINSTDSGAQDVLWYIIVVVCYYLHSWMNFQSLTLVNVSIKNHFPWKQTKEAILFKNSTVFLTVQIDQ